LEQKGPYNFSQDIVLKGLSGTLAFTWTPTESPPLGPETMSPSSKNETSDM
jgi:hypothetical protein